MATPLMSARGLVLSLALFGVFRGQASAGSQPWPRQEPASYFSPDRSMELVVTGHGLRGEFSQSAKYSLRKEGREIAVRDLPVYLKYLEVCDDGFVFAYEYEWRKPDPGADREPGDVDSFIELRCIDLRENRMVTTEVPQRTLKPTFVHDVPRPQISDLCTTPANPNLTVIMWEHDKDLVARVQEYDRDAARLRDREISAPPGPPEMRWTLFAHQQIGHNIALVLSGRHPDGIAGQPPEKVESENGTPSLVVGAWIETKPRWLHVMVFRAAGCELLWEQTFPDCFPTEYRERVRRWDGKPAAPFLLAAPDGFDVVVSDAKRILVRECVKDGLRGFDAAWMPPEAEAPRPVSPESP